MAIATQSWHELERKLSNGGGTGGRGKPESLKQNVMLREEEVAAHQDSEPQPDHSLGGQEKSRTHRFLSQRLGLHSLTILSALWGRLFMG